MSFLKYANNTFSSTISNQIGTNINNSNNIRDISFPNDTIIAQVNYKFLLLF
jgi:hypothetical protein